ncbi:MAG: hypothetical protein Q7S40_02995 [Opitutaceae bacterium]|nr:hypothetical protein [Opitutaceae bacterium]
MKANRLGDVRAEYDSKMLDRAFYETPDFLTLIEPENRAKCIVVGRRGTGKSALFYALQKHYQKSKRTVLIEIAPEDYEIIQLRAYASKVAISGGRYNLVRGAFKIFWRYAIMMEVIAKLRRHERYHTIAGIDELTQRSFVWTKSGKLFFERFNSTIRTALDGAALDDNVVGQLATQLPVRDLEKGMAYVLEQLGSETVVLIDRLDEGYEADTSGLAIIGGLSHAVSSLAGMLERARLALFLRDNILRSIARADSDFSRNIEGQVLRLHWDKYHLFNMICARLRLAYNIEAESTQKLWDRCTAQNIRGSNGFAKCLQLTLYRPRDLLLLLNNAIQHASSHNREHIDNEDVEITAREISVNRFEELKKEYQDTVAGLGSLSRMFTGLSPRYLYSEINGLIVKICSGENVAADLVQELALLGPGSIILQWYSIGFVGIEDEVTGTFIFCHDGKNPDITLPDNKRLLLHPCYWIALGITDTMITSEEAESIHDEYDVEVYSETPALRNKRIGQIMNELEKIPLGVDGASQFELWCKQVLEILYVKSLRNLELHPNRNDIQRRDIVGTNLAVSPVWARIMTDYKARQVVFEVKNVERELNPTEFRQMLSYLGGDYGNIGFFVTRCKTPDLVRGEQLGWIKEMYLKQNRLIVKLTGPWLAGLLSKIRNPQKHDEPSNKLSTLLDRYPRNYLNIRS